MGNEMDGLTHMHDHGHSGHIQHVHKSNKSIVDQKSDTLSIYYLQLALEFGHIGRQDN